MSVYRLKNFINRLIRKGWIICNPKFKPSNLHLHEDGEFISDHIRKTNMHYEFDMLYFIKNKFDCRCVIDIGANIGNHSSFFEKLGSVVWAFEPSKKNFDKLIKNAPQSSCFNIALSDAEAACELVTFGNSMGNNYLSSSFDGRINNEWGKDIQREQTQTRTLDSFNIEEPTFIKIDVEGSEFNVLKGAIKTLTKYNPTLLIEIHTDDILAKFGYPYTRQDIDNFLNTLGYKRILSYEGNNHFFQKKTERFMPKQMNWTQTKAASAMVKGMIGA